MPHLVDEAAIPDRVVQGLDLFFPVHGGFFAVHVLAGIDRIDGHLRVVVIRCGDDDRIDRRVSQHVVIMPVAFHRVFPGDVTARENVVPSRGQPSFGMQVEHIANARDGNVKVAVLELRAQCLAAVLALFGKLLLEPGFLHEPQLFCQAGASHAEPDNADPDQLTFGYRDRLDAGEQVIQPQFTNDFLARVILCVVAEFSQGFEAECSQHRHAGHGP